MGLLPSGVLTVLYSTGGDRRVKDSECLAHFSARQLTVHRRQLFCVWKPVSPRKNKQGDKLLFIPQSPTHMLPSHVKAFTALC